MRAALRGGFFMSKRILSAESGRAMVWHDEQDGKVAIQSVTDVEPAVERAKALRNAGLTRTGMGDRHMASIPLALLGPWALRHGVTWHQVIGDDVLFTKFMREHPDLIVDEASFAVKAKP